jgi:hypothetical protein
MSLLCCYVSIIYYYYYYYLVCEAIGTAATPGLLCQPRDSEDDYGETDGM